MRRHGRAVDLRIERVALGACLRHRCAQLSDRIAGVREILARDRAIRDQRLAPREVVLAALERRLPLGELRTALGVLREQAGDFPDGARELGLRGRDADPRVAGVELDEHVAALDGLCVVDLHGRNGPCHEARDLQHVTGHVRVVGRLVVAQSDEPVQRPGEPGDDQHDAEYEECAPSAGGIAGGGGGSRVVWFAHGDASAETGGAASAGWTPPPRATTSATRPSASSARVATSTRLAAMTRACASSTASWLARPAR